MDRQLIENKLESLRRCLARIEDRCPQSADMLASDPDVQDILALNLTLAVQICVDIGAHLITESAAAAPQTMGQTFDVLAEQGDIAPALRIDSSELLPELTCCLT